MKEIQFLIYRSAEDEVSINPVIKDETIWLNQRSMAELFEVGVPAIAKHLQNIYADGELLQESTVSKMEIVQQEGSRSVIRQVDFYNLDAIISVGYRVNSRRATQFRQWCTYVLRQYAIRGYVIDKKRMENGSFIGVDYFEQLLEEIREIIYPKGNAVRSLLSWIRYKLLDCVFFQKGIATIHVAQRRQLQKLQPSWTADIAIYHNFKKQ